MSKDPHRSAEDFSRVFQTYQPGFSDIYQLVYMLVYEGQAKCWMKSAQGEHPERDSEKETLNFWQDASTPTGSLQKAIPTAFPKPFD